jgi:CHAT domain-containing protein/tetratricopeptide (TPR) repeat protein
VAGAGEYGERDRLVAALRDRVRHFIREMDPRPLFGSDADQELAAVTPVAAGPPADAEAAAAAGTVAWLRYLVYEGPDVAADQLLLGEAAAYYRLIFPGATELVPEPLRELLESITEKEQFVPFCAYWHSLRSDRKGLMLLHEVLNRLIDAGASWETLAKLSDRLGRQVDNPISLSAAIVAMSGALNAVKPDHPGRWLMEAMLGNQLHDRALLTSSAADLDAAVEHLGVAVALAGNRPSRAASQADLSDALQDRYRETFRAQDLAAALAAGEQAVADAPDRPLVLHKYANALLLQFQETRDLAVRDEVIGYIGDALQLTPPGGDGRAAMLAGLAAALRSGYRETRDPRELDRAIDLARESLDELRSADAASRLLSFHTLGVALLTRFQRNEGAADLRAAVEFARQAVELTPAPGARRALCQSTYAGALRARWEHDGEFTDMTEAIELMGQAAEATPAGHPSRAMYVMNISAAAQRLYLSMSAPAEVTRAALEAADGELRALLASVPDDGPATRLAALLAARGALLTTKYEQTQAAADLDEAVRCCRESVRLTPEDGGEHADYAANLASALLDQARLTGEIDDLAQAIAAQLDVMANPAARARSRIAAAHTAASLLADDDGDFEHAATLLAWAVEQMTLTVPRQLAREDQEYWLGQFGDLAADAAACAVRADRARDAVTVLELGRGVMIGQSLQLRSAVDELRTVAPALADRFEYIRSELDAPASPVEELRPHEFADAVAVFDARRALAARRSELAAELDRLTGQIRELPGMAGFLRRPEFVELAAAGGDGPVVFLNVSRFGSHALIVNQAAVEPVPLDAVGPQSVREQVDRLQAALKAVDTAKAQAMATGMIAAIEAVQQAQDSVREVLDWLWRAVVEPVLARRTAEASPQRIWWAPVGLLSFLPVHAAVSRADGAPGALDLLVSSYTPTVAALTQARKHRQRPPADDGLLVVAMPVTPGGLDLPGAAREAESLTTRFPGGEVLGSWPRATGEATRVTVQTALPRHAVAHFACHARCDPADPAASVLFLQDHQDTPLTLADILALRLDQGQLAYLSACETAATAERLANEALHLVTAFGLAGYPQVIGTLWRIDDDAGSIMTDQFYERLSRPGHPAWPQPELAAQALHAATLYLRAENPDDPILWAAHIHSGA